VRSDFTSKQKAFVEHYLITLNGTEAARRAKYKGDDNTLGVVAYENLRKPKIRAEIDRRMKQLSLSAEETLYRITEHATGTMEDFLSGDDEWGYTLSLDKGKDAGKLHLVKKYKETEITIKGKDDYERTTLRREIELYPADGALDKLMRYHGLYNDKVVHTWRDNVPEEFQPIMEEFFRTAVSRVSKKLNESD
jgi:phage terminase small subunit